MTPSETIELISKAMGAVTPEAWELIVCDDQRPAVVSSGDVICLPDPNHGRDAGLPDKMDMANFAYIAACNPVAMREVLALARQAEALTGIGSAHDLVGDWLGEGTDDLPDDTPVRIEIGKRTIIADTLGSLRRTRALLSKESAEQDGSATSSSGTPKTWGEWEREKQNEEGP